MDAKLLQLPPPKYEMARRQFQLQPSSPEKRRTALDSFDVYRPFVIEPKDICWAGLVTQFLSNPDAMSATLLYTVLQITLRESQNVGKMCHFILSHVQCYARSSQRHGRRFWTNYKPLAHLIRFLRTQSVFRTLSSL